MATEREELIEKAEEIGLTFKKNISTVDLQLLVDEKEAELANAAIEAKAAGAKTADPETSKAIAKEVKTEAAKVSGMRASTEMVKVTITALDPRMREIPSNMFTHMGKYGTKKQVVKFGKTMFVYKVIVDMIKEKKALIQVNASLGSNQASVEYQMSPAFMVQEIPLTDEELEEIKSK